MMTTEEKERVIAKYGDIIYWDEYPSNLMMALMGPNTEEPECDAYGKGTNHEEVVDSLYKDLDDRMFQMAYVVGYRKTNA